MSTFSESMKFNQSTSDNLNPADSTIPLLKKTDETLRLIERASIVSHETIGHSWIAGSSSNGIVGTNTNTQDGLQQVVGGAGRVYTLHTIINPNNVFKERFRDTQFKSATEPQTANWDTTNFNLAMSSSSNHATVYNTVANISSMSYADFTITQALLECDETKWNSDDEILYYLSADGGANFEEVQNGELFTFATSGTDLQGKVVFFGNGGSETYIENLQVKYY